MSKKQLTVTFLGTGSSLGVPVIGWNHPVCLSLDPRDRRLRSSVLIQQANTTLVIDCGPDFKEQMIQSRCVRLDAVLLTHEHADHTAGLDDVRPFNFIMEQAVAIYGEPHVLSCVRKRYDYCFTQPHYPGAPHFDLHEIDSFHPFCVGSIEIIPFRVAHGALGILGFRIDDFVYITDASALSEVTLIQIEGCEVLVINALRDGAPHHSQFNLEQALATIDRIDPKSAWLTHLSPLIGLHSETSCRLPSRVQLAYDGLVVKI